VVIAGGGTGGHTSPGLAVAAALRARGHTVTWIGSRHGVEARRVPAVGIPYVAIPTGKLRRYWSWQNLLDLAVNVPLAHVQAWLALSRLRPGVVFGTGGFVALPVVLAAAVKRLPVVVHEQTAVPGLANRIAARVARRIAITYEPSARWFPADRVTLTGNPLRAELRAGDRAEAVARFGLDPALPLVYVTGGAQGAHRINRAVGEALAALLSVAQVIHQCGDNAETGDRRWLEDRRAALPSHLAGRYHIRAYLDVELPAVYAAVALVIGRAGAGTVNECCQLGVPALYVPLPRTAGDEQTANARLVERAGGAVVLPQAELSPVTLAERAVALLEDPARLKAMGERARSLAIPDAAERLADLILSCGGPRQGPPRPPDARSVPGNP
jgi:UDP-N-acetylglucosamine--N-acetylmuramyl-(pentapeptide) pyrophosphoryl-undecaprenol N-acetylglucosamine transferase